ncbi:hypothetical protein NYA22BAC_00782 [Parasphingorhabdus sp. NYA22]
MQTCPKCGTAVPYTKALWGMGTPFACTGCEAMLIIHKNYWIPLSGFTLFFFAKSGLDGWPETTVLFLVIAALVLLLSKFFMPAVIVKE